MSDGWWVRGCGGVGCGVRSEVVKCGGAGAGCRCGVRVRGEVVRSAGVRVQG